ncbi:MAG: response regulator [Kiritimatiellae bacterium]|nr:response regulator [Kiritimatiellia bacterium]
MLRVLIIDDDRTIVRTLQMAFSEHGARVFAASDPIQGVRLAIDERPDVILLDLQMPAGGGAAVLQSLSRNVLTHLIPVICITALQGDDVRDACLAAGSRAFITKPFSPAAVVAKAYEVAGLRPPPRLSDESPAPRGGDSQSTCT